ncbi:MAG: D-sedoheptulose 7-phosphate isomerase [Nanoarchaeota archaeon]|nr:D-sedoheptulose 7-phosphate isomerase [Nanoarchaeota archaeon]
MATIKEMLQEGVETKKKFLAEEKNIEVAARKAVIALTDGRKILICGNGGSAADSQHIAAELVGRYKKERRGLPAIALTTDSSILTAWSNDYDYESVFERQVQALGQKGDVLFALSTSGNSSNILKAAKKAREMGLTVVSFTGKDGGKLKAMSDVNINAPSGNTPRIQECHMLAYHIICEIIDEELS